MSGETLAAWTAPPVVAAEWYPEYVCFNHLPSGKVQICVRAPQSQQHQMGREATLEMDRAAFEQMIGAALEKLHGVCTDNQGEKL